MEYKIEEIRYRSSDEEHDIYARLFIPENRVKGVVQISHGMNGYIEKYDAFAKSLVQEGFVVCGNTHLGHRDNLKTEEEFGFFGEFNGAKNLVNDVKKLTQIIKERFPEKKIILFGHSMGSFIARCYINEYSEEIDGAIFSATAGPQKLIDTGIAFLNTLILKKGYHFRSQKLYRILFKSANREIKNPKTDFDWVSKNNNDFIASLSKTPFTVTGLRDILLLIKNCNMQPNINKIAKKLPIYFFSGSEDPLGQYGEGVKRAVKLYQKAGIEDVTLKIYEGDRHECLSEDNRAEVIDDIVEWIEKRIGEKR